MTDKSGSLAGRTALVTGAAKRLGRAVAMALAGEGANVVVHYNSSADEAAAVVGEIEAAGPKAWALQADLAEADQAAQLMPRAIDAAGPVDILINSAAIFPKGRITEMTPQDLLLNVQLHALAPLLLSRALAEQGRSGHVVNFLDARVTGYDREHAAYHLSKRMLFALTRMLALELAPRVAVNGVAPGLILAPEGLDEGYLRGLAHTNPMQRTGSIRGITDAVLFLLKADFVTGQVLFIDGGRNLRGRLYD